MDYDLAQTCDWPPESVRLPRHPRQSPECRTGRKGPPDARFLVCGGKRLPGAERPQLQKALEAGRKRQYYVLLFWSLDRLSRQGVLPTLLLLNQLSQYGVKYRSLQEQWIDSLGALSDAIIGILATVAKFEAERLSNRVRSGLERARSQGKALGRPRVIVDRSKIAKLRDQGLSLREIAAKKGKGTMTVHRALKAPGVHFARRTRLDANHCMKCSNSKTEKTFAA